MDKNIFNKVCSLNLKNNGDWCLCDCDNNDLNLGKGVFPSAMKKHYYEKRNGRGDISTVWILVGYDKEDNCVCEQVGRTVSLYNSLEEIKENVKKIYYENYKDSNKLGIKKYSDLKSKGYNKLVFYEVDIDNYLKDDKVFNQLFNVSLCGDDILENMYYFIRAAYVEGKIAFELGAVMYNHSVPDKFSYLYYKDKKEMIDKKVSIINVK